MTRAKGLTNRTTQVPELTDLLHCHLPAAWGTVCQASHFPALPSAENCLFPVSQFL